MKRVVYLTVTLMAVLFATTSIMAKEKFPLPQQEGVLEETPNAAHLYLYEKNTSDWTKVEGGAWGKLTYDPVGTEFKYVFNGHKVLPDTSYTLIYYPDPWPGTGLQCLGEATSNHGGNVHIMGSNPETGSLPVPSDENYTWDISGDWLLNFHTGTGNREFRDLVQDDNGHVIGEFWWFNGTNWEKGGTLVGDVVGSKVTLFYDRGLVLNYTGTFTGTINESGMIGTFTDSKGGTYDWNTTGEPTFIGGAKIWLVSSDDVDCDSEVKSMKAWNPSEYLFEENLITFTDMEL